MIISVNGVVCPTCHGPYIPGESVCRVCGKTVSRESRAFDGKSAARRILLLGRIRKSQTLGDGRRFDYSYFREGNEIRENEIVYPNGLKTYVQYIPGGYLESLPSPIPGHAISKTSN